VAATVFALLIRLFLLEDFRIASPSMYPSLITGDLVFVSKFDFNLHLPFSTYEIVRFRSPRRSEIVAFSLPDRGRETYVKRVVAVEGDKVAIQKGVLIINGVPVRYRSFSGTVIQPSDKKLHLTWEETEPGIKYPIQIADRDPGKDYGPVDVPTGHFFALGDNRTESNDSRVWGPIPYSCLNGRVALIWLSLNPQGGLRKGRSGIWVSEL
jgi:signal peptidase I